VEYLFSDRKRHRGSRHAWWMQAAAAGWFALCGTLAHAGVISLSSNQVGSVVTLTATDSAPLDMCTDDGVCGADFTIHFNSAVLEFIEFSEISNFFVGTNSLASGEVVVSFAALPEFFSGDPEVLFSIGFNALLTQQVLVEIKPIDTGGPDLYLPGPAEISVDAIGPAATVPEPNTALLAMLALAVLAWRRQTNLAQDQRPIPSA
jgi:hypothetical protein